MLLPRIHKSSSVPSALKRQRKRETSQHKIALWRRELERRSGCGVALYGQQGSTFPCLHVCFLCPVAKGSSQRHPQHLLRNVSGGSLRFAGAGEEASSGKEATRHGNQNIRGSRQSCWTICLMFAEAWLEMFMLRCCYVYVVLLTSLSDCLSILPSKVIYEL